MNKPLSSRSFRVGIFEPRIPQNTGNIGRTCLAYNLPLDLIKPLGFSIEDKYLKRAGLDYWKNIDLNLHENFELYTRYNSNSRIIGFSKKDGIDLSLFKFNNDDCLLFGREDTGIPQTIREKCHTICTIPMPGIARKEDKKGVRSLNISVACGIAIFNAYLSCRD